MKMTKMIKLNMKMKAKVEVVDDDGYLAMKVSQP